MRGAKYSCDPHSDQLQVARDESLLAGCIGTELTFWSSLGEVGDQKHDQAPSSGEQAQCRNHDVDGRLC